MRISYKLKTLAATACAAIMAGQAHAAVGLVWMHPPGGQSSNIRLASNGAAATGVMNDPDGTGGVYHWDAATGIKLVDTQSRNSSIGGISGNGKVVAGYNYEGPNGYVPWIWSQGGGPATMLASPFMPRSGVPQAVSGNGGVIVGDFESGFGLRSAFKWTPATGITLLQTGSFNDYSQALAVSDNGDVIAGYSGNRDVPFGAGIHAVLWGPSGMVELGTLPGGIYGSSAFGVSASGNAVVGAGSSSSGGQAFRWMEDTGMMGLGVLPGGYYSSTAKAVSGDGGIVVGYASSLGGTQAFVWDELHGMMSLSSIMQANGLDVTGWNIIEASGISADGTVIAATRITERDTVESFIVSGLTIIPESSSAGLAGLALGTAMLRRRRGRA